MSKKNTQPNVLFIYPPTVDPTVPPISHSRLKPSLPGSWKAEFVDENISFVYYVISVVLSLDFNKEFMSRQNVNLRERWNDTEENHSNEKKFLNDKSKKNRGFLNNKDDLSIIFNASLKNKDIAFLKEDILKSIAILKSKLFYDIDHYVAANSILELVYEKFSQFYYPSLIGYATSKLIYNLYNSSDLQKSLKDESKNPFINFFNTRIREYGFRDIIAISVIYSSQLIPALTLGKLYNEMYPESLILLGGPSLFHIRGDIQQKFDFIDMVVPLDGEYFFINCSKLIEHLIDEKVKNKAVADNNINNCFGFYELKGLLPDYSFTSMDKYLLPVPVILFDITRGCFYGRCVFCAYGFNIAPYRVMPIEEVMKTIKSLVEVFNVYNFIFSVDVIDTDYLELLAEKLIKFDYKINYYLDARLEKRFTDKKFVAKLARSGCRIISFGMESACKKTLVKMRKGINPQYFTDVFKNLYNNEIHANLNVIHGFPGESSGEFLKTMDFLFRNEKYITTVGISEFTLLRGSIMEKEYKKFGINSITPNGDFNIWYETDYKFPEDYPDFNSILKEVISVFPVYGRLTGSTSDYLLYASKFTPSQMKNILKRAIKLKLN